MTKEVLTKENIREDLLKVCDYYRSVRYEWHSSYFIPYTMAAVFVGYFCHLVFHGWWVGLLFMIPAAYHIVQLEIANHQNREVKNAFRNEIERGDFSISVEKLSHIAEETIYEPHMGHRRAHATKLVHVFYFRSGAGWRHPPVDEHYTWSKLYDMSPEGLENTSIADDEFYYVRLQSDGGIGYIYNKKLFEYKEG